MKDIAGQPINQFFQAPPVERLRALQALQPSERGAEEEVLMQLLKRRPDVRRELMPDTQHTGTPESWNPFEILSKVLGG